MTSSARLAVCARNDRRGTAPWTGVRDQYMAGGGAAPTPEEEGSLGTPTRKAEREEVECEPPCALLGRASLSLSLSRSRSLSLSRKEPAAVASVLELLPAGLDPTAAAAAAAAAPLDLDGLALSAEGPSPGMLRLLDVRVLLGRGSVPLWLRRTLPGLPGGCKLEVLLRSPLDPGTAAAPAAPVPPLSTARDEDPGCPSRSRLLRVGEGGAPSFDTGRAPSFDTGRAPSFDTGRAPSFDTGRAPSFEEGRALLPSLEDGLLPVDDPGRRRCGARGEARCVVPPAGAAAELAFRLLVAQRGRRRARLRLPELGCLCVLAAY